MTCSSINSVLLKISQNSLENISVGVFFIIMLLIVASVFCQEYIKDKILIHVTTFLSSNSFLFCCFVLFFEVFWSSLWNFFIVYTLWCWYQKCIQNSETMAWNNNYFCPKLQRSGFPTGAENMGGCSSKFDGWRFKILKY